MTAGCFTTSPGGPSAISLPWSSTLKCSTSFIMACMVCSMITMVTPSSVDPPDDRQHVGELVVAEPGERFVEQQQARTRRERARELHQTELLRGQPAGEGVGLGVGEADAFECRIGVALGLRVGRGGRIGADDDVFQHGHARESAHDLERAADAEPADRVRLQSDQVRSGKADATGMRP